MKEGEYTVDFPSFNSNRNIQMALAVRLASDRHQNATILASHTASAAVTVTYTQPHSYSSLKSRQCKRITKLG